MSGMASKLWAAVKPTCSVAAAVNRKLCTTATVERRHKDFLGNRNIWRFGYEDKLKMSGTLPRIGNDYARVPSKKIFKPQNPFAPSNALYGQNDYFDILGDDQSHVTQTHYHIPKYLRGLDHHKHHYKLLIKQRQELGTGGMPEVLPMRWDRWDRNHQRYKTRFKKMMNQKWWINYSGLKFGDVHNPYKTKYPF